MRAEIVSAFLCASQMAITLISQLFRILSAICGKQDVKINCLGAVLLPFTISLSWWKRLSRVAFNYCWSCAVYAVAIWTVKSVETPHKKRSHKINIWSSQNRENSPRHRNSFLMTRTRHEKILFSSFRSVKNNLMHCLECYYAFCGCFCLVFVVCLFIRSIVGMWKRIVTSDNRTKQPFRTPHLLAGPLAGSRN